MAQVRNHNNLTARQQARLDRKLLKSGILTSNADELVDLMKCAKSPDDAIEVFKKFQQQKIEELKPWKIKNFKKQSKFSIVDPKSDEFLFSFQWRKLRLEALDKYGHKCVSCGSNPKLGAILNVDHIKPRKFFSELALDINNLQVLCSERNHGKGNWNHSDYRS